MHIHLEEKNILITCVQGEIPPQLYAENIDKYDQGPNSGPGDAIPMQIY